MNRVILIKYGELSTKKGNRNFFINTLYNNVKNKLSNYDVKISKDRARMLIEFNDEDLEKIKLVVDKIFGIHTYHLAYVCESNEESIKNTLFEIISKEKFSTFKIETKRSDKNFPIDSQSFNRVLGGFVLRNFDNISVDVHNPDLWIKVEIREKNNTFIYFNSFNGSGGYPVGTQPKGMLMLSGGIDSPVAGYLAMKRGIKLEAVYFEAIPHTSIEARNKVISLCEKLADYTVNFIEEVYLTDGMVTKSVPFVVIKCNSLDVLKQFKDTDDGEMGKVYDEKALTIKYPNGDPNIFKVENEGDMLVGKDDYISSYKTAGYVCE